jgi:hypothetical protein
MALTAAGCGGEDDDATPPPPTGAAAATARSLVPKLDDLGFTLTESGPDPGNPSFDSAVALYKGKEPQQQVQVRIYVLPTEAAANTQFNAFAEALRNPPKEFLGVDAKFVDTASPQIGDVRKSYKTQAPDSRGYTAFSDVYRKGRTVVLTQVVDKTAEGAPVREQVGTRAMEKAP